VEGPIVALVGLVILFVVLDLAAFGWGVDSRPTLADDHQR
jgi:nitrogen fixation-related uncharacterized protein